MRRVSTFARLRGRVLGDARATFLNLPLLLQLAGDRLLETADFLAQAVRLAGNLGNRLRELRKSSAWAMRVVERLIDVAPAVPDGLDDGGLLRLQLPQTPFATQDALGVGDLRANGDLAVGPRDHAIARDETRPRCVRRSRLDGLDGRIEHVDIAKQKLGDTLVLGSEGDPVKQARAGFGARSLDGRTTDADERELAPGKLGLQEPVDQTAEACASLVMSPNMSDPSRCSTRRSSAGGAGEELALRARRCCRPGAPWPMRVADATHQGPCQRARDPLSPLAVS